MLGNGRIKCLGQQVVFAVHGATMYILDGNLLSRWAAVPLRKVHMHVIQLLFVALRRKLAMLRYCFLATFAHVGLMQTMLRAIGMRKHVATENRH